MDEDLETEEQSAELPAEAMDLQGLAASNPALAAYMRKYEADIAAADAARQKQAKTKKDIFEKGEKEILARRYGAPTTSEQLFALGAALLAPRRYKGFAGTLDKITPVLGQMDKLQSSAEAQRNEARDRLRREYLTGIADADVAAAQARVEARGRLLSPLASATKPQGMGSWSETLQRYVPKDRAVVVASGRLPDGRSVDRMSDGSMRALNNDGSYSYYDAGGNPIKVGGQ